jgi:hypothetical protein
MEIRRKSLGEGHADFGTSLLTLGSIRLAAGAGEEAEELTRRGLDILGKRCPRAIGASQTPRVDSAPASRRATRRKKPSAFWWPDTRACCAGAQRRTLGPSPLFSESSPFTRALATRRPPPDTVPGFVTDMA